MHEHQNRLVTAGMPCGPVELGKANLVACITGRPSAGVLKHVSIELDWVAKISGDRSTSAPNRNIEIWIDFFRGHLRSYKAMDTIVNTAYVWSFERSVLQELNPGAKKGVDARHPSNAKVRGTLLIICCLAKTCHSGKSLSTYTETKMYYVSKDNAAIALARSSQMKTL